MATKTINRTVDKKLFDQTASALAKLKREYTALRADYVRADGELVRFRSLYETLLREHELMLARIEAKERLERAGVDREHSERFLSAFACSDAETTEALTGCIIELISARRAQKTAAAASEPSQ